MFVFPLKNLARKELTSVNIYLQPSGSMALGKLYDCLSAGEATLYTMGASTRESTDITLTS